MRHQRKRLLDILHHPGWQAKRVAHHVIVQLDTTTDEAQFDLVLKQHDAKIERNFQTIPWRIIEVADPVKLHAVIKALYKRQLILDAEPNYIGTMP